MVVASISHVRDRNYVLDLCAKHLVICSTGLLLILCQLCCFRAKLATRRKFPLFEAFPHHKVNIRPLATELCHETWLFEELA